MAKKWNSLMRGPENGEVRSTRLIDEAHGNWEVAAKTHADSEVDLLRIRVYRRREDGPSDWGTIVLDEEMNIVALTIDDREKKSFEDAERILKHKQLIT
jgi:hypothetical protein